MQQQPSNNASAEVDANCRKGGALSAVCGSHRAEGDRPEEYRGWSKQGYVTGGLSRPAQSQPPSESVYTVAAAAVWSSNQIAQSTTCHHWRPAVRRMLRKGKSSVLLGHSISSQEKNTSSRSSNSSSDSGGSNRTTTLYPSVSSESRCHWRLRSQQQHSATISSSSNSNSTSKIASAHVNGPSRSSYFLLQLPTHQIPQVPVGQLAYIGRAALSIVHCPSNRTLEQKKRPLKQACLCDQCDTSPFSAREKFIGQRIIWSL